MKTDKSLRACVFRLMDFLEALGLQSVQIKYVGFRDMDDFVDRWDAE